MKLTYTFGLTLLVIGALSGFIAGRATADSHRARPFPLAKAAALTQGAVTDAATPTGSPCTSYDTFSAADCATWIDFARVDGCWRDRYRHATCSASYGFTRDRCDGQDANCADNPNFAVVDRFEHYVCPLRVSLWHWRSRHLRRSGPAFAISGGDCSLN